MYYQALEKLYTFWFSNSNNWFNQSDVFDNLVIQLFSQLLNSASLDIEITNSSIFTSIIILYDQIPRNIFRGTSSAYSTDHIAYETAKFLSKFIENSIFIRAKL